MGTGWSEKHVDSPGSRIHQLLFLLLFEKLSGISLSTAEPQILGSILPDLHRYWPCRL